MVEPVKRPLTKDQLNILDRLVLGMSHFIHKDSTIHVYMSAINESNPDLPRYVYSNTDNPTEVEQSLLALLEQLNAYASGGELTVLETNCESYLDGLVGMKEASLPAQEETTIDWLYEGLITLFRAAFRLLDVMLSKMGAELKDKENPYAVRWAGRNHFFQHKSEPAQLSEGVLRHQFHEAIESLSDKNPKPAPAG